MLVKTKKGEDFPHQSLACGNTDRRQTIKQYLGHRFRYNIGYSFSMSGLVKNGL
jgi:hypothetical protein